MLHHRGCMQSFGTEAAVMLHLQDPSRHPTGATCPSIPRLLGVSTPPPNPTDPGAAGFVTELLMDAGSETNLHDILHQRRAEVKGAATGTAGGTPEEPMLDLGEVWEIADTIAQAVLHVHEAGWAHGDIKPQNIVFDDHGNAMLIDFGLARPLGAEVTNLIGTDGLTPPEVLSAFQAGAGCFTMRPKMDVYAFGSLLLLMVMCASARELHPLPSDDLKAVVKVHGYAGIFIKNELTCSTDCELNCSSDMKHIIRLATKVNARDRASMRHLARLVSKGRLKYERAAARLPETAPAPMPCPPAAAALPPVAAPVNILPHLFPVRAAPPSLESPETPMVSHCGTPHSALQSTPAHAGASTTASSYSGSPMKVVRGNCPPQQQELCPPEQLPTADGGKPSEQSAPPAAGKAPLPPPPGLPRRVAPPPPAQPPGAPPTAPPPQVPPPQHMQPRASMPPPGFMPQQHCMPPHACMPPPGYMPQQGRMPHGGPMQPHACMPPPGFMPQHGFFPQPVFMPQHGFMPHHFMPPPGLVVYPMMPARNGVGPERKPSTQPAPRQGLKIRRPGQATPPAPAQSAGEANHG